LTGYAQAGKSVTAAKTEVAITTVEYAAKRGNLRMQRIPAIPAQNTTPKKTNREIAKSRIGLAQSMIHDIFLWLVRSYCCLAPP
jgi:hypothetical protein